MKTEAYINKIIEDTGLSRTDIQSLVEEKIILQGEIIETDKELCL